MRVTDQIINETARRAGVPVNMSLVDYLNKSQKDDFSDVFGTEASTNLAKKNSYEKLEKKAEELAKNAQAFLAEGQDSMFAKAKESGDYEEVYSQVEKLLSPRKCFSPCHAAKNASWAASAASSGFWHIRRVRASTRFS